MRTIVLSGCLVGLGATLLGTPQTPVRDPAVILSQAREALGGDKAIGNVKSFVANGRTRQVRGDNLVPIEFEISVELPDKYVRKDEIPAQESGPTSTGFNGEDLIQLPLPQAPAAAPGRAGAPAPPQAMLDAQRRTRVNGVKQDFMRLTLGMFASSFASYPLTFSYVGQAEAPEGKADVIDAKGPDNFTVRLFINSQTHLPIMASWTVTPPVRGRPAGPGGMPPGAAPAGPGGPPAAGAPPAPGAAAAPGGQAPPAARPQAPAPTGAPAAPPAGATPSAPGAPPQPPKPVEHRLYYADYRPVGNLQLPFRIRRAVGTDTTEETTFDRFRINAKIDPKKFEVLK